MTTCREFTEVITDYLEGPMRLAQRMRSFMHLLRCRGCRAYLRQMRVMVGTLGRLPDDPMPTELRDALLRRFRAMRPPREASGRGARRVLLLAAIEAAAGGRRGWWIAALTFALLVVLTFMGARQGALGAGSRCLAEETCSGVGLLALVGLTAISARCRLSPASYVVTAMAGSLLAFATLHFTCGLARVAPHALAFHVGGVVLAGLMGITAARLPALR